MFPRTPARSRRLLLIGSFPKKSRSSTSTRTPASLRDLTRPSQVSGVTAGSAPLALPDPGHRWFGRLARRLVLAITPVTARALFVMRGPAGRADHGAIIKVPTGFRTASPGARDPLGRARPAAQPTALGACAATGGPGGRPPGPALR